MSTMGVVAGFMTHESQTLFRDMSVLIDRISSKPSITKDTEIALLINEANESLNELRGFLEYTELFIKGIHNKKVQSFKSAPQINRIIKKFGGLADRRSIIVRNEIKTDLITAPTMVTIYSGVLLNLYTNALKAVITRSDSSDPKTILFRGWNEPGWHVVQVIDNGIGIPPSLVDHIWNPLFSTTASGVDPFGSGMGLGLSIIKQLINQIQGKISLVQPPKGFNTCFEVRFRNVRK